MVKILVWGFSPRHESFSMRVIALRVLKSGQALTSPERRSTVDLKGPISYEDSTIFELFLLSGRREEGLRYCEKELCYVRYLSFDGRRNVVPIIIVIAVQGGTGTKGHFRIWVTRY